MKMFKNYFLLLILTLVFSLTGCSPDTDIDYNPPVSPSYSYYTIKYDANGGNGKLPENKSVKGGETIIVASKGALNKSGKSFDTWNTKVDGSGTAYAEGSSLIVNENITLYAQWSDRPYIITYDINNGIGTVPEQEEVISGGNVILPEGSGLSRTGYIFNGWNTNANGTGNHYAAGSSLAPIDDDMNFYAIWAAPAINNADSYKTVTSDGTVKITLLKGVNYVHESMKKYYLYRSEEENGEYIKISEFTPTSPSSQFILEDNTVDWNGSNYYYYYKVAAVLEDDNEMMSIGGMYIYMSSFPTTYMMRSQSSLYSIGYCGLILKQTGSEVKWEETPSVPNTRYELKKKVGVITGLPIPAGNYTMSTASAKDDWKSPVEITLKRAHITTIYIYENKAVSEFDKSCWRAF